MLLSLKKNVKKQAKRVCKQTEKLYKEFGEGKKSSADYYDTNTVLMRMEKVEIEIKALRDLVNHEKQQQYMERMGKSPQQ